MDDFSDFSDEELERIANGGEAQQPARQNQDFSDFSDEELERIAAQEQPQVPVQDSSSEDTSADAGGSSDYGFFDRQNDQMAAQRGNRALDGGLGAAEAVTEGVAPFQRGIQEGISREQTENKGAFLDGTAWKDAIERHGEEEDESLRGYKAKEIGAVETGVRQFGHELSAQAANMPFFIGEAVKGVRGLARRAYSNRATDVLIDYARDAGFSDEDIEKAKEFSQGDPRKMHDFFRDAAELELRQDSRVKAAAQQRLSENEEGLGSKIAGGALGMLPMIEEFAMTGGLGKALGIVGKAAKAEKIGWAERLVEGLKHSAWITPVMGSEMARKRYGELTADEYGEDEEGSLVKMEGDTAGRALAKAIPGGLGEAAIFSLPIGEAAFGWATPMITKALRTKVGNTVANMYSNYVKYGQMTGLRGQPQMLALMDLNAFKDEVLGASVKDSDDSTFDERWQRFKDETLTLEGQRDMFISTLGVIAVQGGAALAKARVAIGRDRRSTDNVLRKVYNIPQENLDAMSPEHKAMWRELIMRRSLGSRDKNSRGWAMDEAKLRKFCERLDERFGEAAKSTWDKMGQYALKFDNSTGWENKGDKASAFASKFKVPSAAVRDADGKLVGYDVPWEDAPVPLPDGTLTQGKMFTDPNTDISVMKYLPTDAKAGDNGWVYLIQDGAGRRATRFGYKDAMDAANEMSRQQQKSVADRGGKLAALQKLYAELMPGEKPLAVDSEAQGSARLGRRMGDGEIAFTDDAGRQYYVLDKIESPEQLRKAVLHEVGRHRGLDLVFEGNPSGKAGFVVGLARNGDPVVQNQLRVIADRMVARGDIEKPDDIFKRDKSGVYLYANKIEEVYAHLFDHEDVPDAPGWWDAHMNAVRGNLRKVFHGLPVSRAEAEEVYRGAMDRLAKETGGAVEYVPEETPPTPPTPPSGERAEQMQGEVAARRAEGRAADFAAAERALGEEIGAEHEDLRKRREARETSERREQEIAAQKAGMEDYEEAERQRIERERKEEQDAQDEAELQRMLDEDKRKDYESRKKAAEDSLEESSRIMAEIERKDYEDRKKRFNREGLMNEEADRLAADEQIRLNSIESEADRLAQEAEAVRAAEKREYRAGVERAEKEKQREEQDELRRSRSTWKEREKARIQAERAAREGKGQEAVPNEEDTSSAQMEKERLELVKRNPDRQGAPRMTRDEYARAKAEYEEAKRKWREKWRGDAEGAREGEGAEGEFAGLPRITVEAAPKDKGRTAPQNDALRVNYGAEDGRGGHQIVARKVTDGDGKVIGWDVNAVEKDGTEKLIASTTKPKKDGEAAIRAVRRQIHEHFGLPYGKEQKDAMDAERRRIEESETRKEIKDEARDGADEEPAKPEQERRDELPPEGEESLPADEGPADAEGEEVVVVHHANEGREGDMKKAGDDALDALFDDGFGEPPAEATRSAPKEEGTTTPPKATEGADGGKTASGGSSGFDFEEFDRINANRDPSTRFFDVNDELSTDRRDENWRLVQGIAAMYDQKKIRGFYDFAKYMKRTNPAWYAEQKDGLRRLWNYAAETTGLFPRVGDYEARDAIRSADEGRNVRDISGINALQAALQDIDVEMYPAAQLDRSDARVPNTKLAADPKSGIVPGHELKGRPRSLLSKPILGVEFEDGTVSVGTGRHRAELYSRYGMDIPMRRVREADGWVTKRPDGSYDFTKVRLLDALDNIQDSKGTIEDYVAFFRDVQIPRAEAESEGFLSSKEARTAYALANDAIDDVRNSANFEGGRRAGYISPEQAGAIADAAPKGAWEHNETVQRQLLKDVLKDRTMDPTDIAVDAGLIADDIRREIAKGKVFQMDLFGNVMDAGAELREKKRDYIRDQIAQYERLAKDIRAAKNSSNGLAIKREDMRRLGINERNVNKDEKTRRAEYEKAAQKAALRAIEWRTGITSQLKPEDRAQMERDLGIEPTDAGAGAQEGSGRFFDKDEEMAIREKPERARKYLRDYPRADSERIMRNFRRLKGTPWMHAAIKALSAHEEMEQLLRNPKKELADDSFLASSPKIAEAVREGEDGIFEYLADPSHGIIGHAAKPVNSVSGSMTDCNPSSDCAKFCYTSNGRGMYPNVIAKAELSALAIRTDPKRAADLTARQFRAMPDYFEGRSLRLLDRGDLSEEWVDYIRELNRQGVRTQVFTKRPEILRELMKDGGDVKNTLMLSVDDSNYKVALEKENADLPVAVVWRGEQDNAMLNQFKERFERSNGVVLPVMVGRRTLDAKEILKVPEWARKRLCPIDAGWHTVSDWNCTRCDARDTMGVGCFFRHTPKALGLDKYLQVDDRPLVERQKSVIIEHAKEIEDDIRASIRDESERANLIRDLANLRAKILGGIDPEAEGGVSPESGIRLGGGQEGARGVAAGAGEAGESGDGGAAYRGWLSKYHLNDTPARRAEWAKKHPKEVAEPPREKQTALSGDTSLNQNPSGNRYAQTHGLFKPGTRNIDIGAGKFDKATQFLREQGVENIPYDPVNRDAETNRRAAESVRENPADTATVHNVLNVIDNDAVMEGIVNQAARAIKKDGTAIFTIYEGDRSGNGRVTTKGYQRNAKASAYVPVLEKYFGEVETHGNVITARQPKDVGPTFWAEDSSFDRGVRFFNIDEEAARRVHAKGQDEARRMEGAGAGRREIWEKTGWWKGKDGKWRFEIKGISPADTKKMLDFALASGKFYDAKRANVYTFTLNDLEKAMKASGERLPDSVKTLLAAYPKLGTEKIEVDRMAKQPQDGVLGYATSGKKGGTIHLYEQGTTADTLNHELQHRIQEMSGMAGGTNRNGKSFGRYTQEHGEWEARQAATRAEMTDEERANTAPWETADRHGVEEDMTQIDEPNRARIRPDGEPEEPEPADPAMERKTGIFEKAKTAVADRYDPIKQMVIAAGKRDSKAIHNGGDPYDAMRLLHGHNEAARKRYEDIWKRPFEDMLRKSGVTVDDVGMYMISMNAKDRNRKILNRTGALDGAGLSDADADKIRTDLRARLGDAKMGKIEEMADFLWKMQKEGMERRVESGRISREMADLWAQEEPHHVPMRDDLSDEDGEYNRSTRQWRKSDFAKAEGRRDMADNPVEFMFKEYQDAVYGANINEARRALADFVRTTPGIGTVRKGVRRGKAWSFTHRQIEDFPDPNYREQTVKGGPGRPNLVSFKEGGNLYMIELNGKQGERVAEAVIGRGVVNMWKPVAAFTRGYASTATELSPTFLGRNFVADMIEASLNTMADKGLIKGGASAVKNVVNALRMTRTIRKYITTGRFEGEFADTMRRYVESGASIGGMGNEGYAELKNDLGKVSSGKHGVADVLKFVGRAISNFNKQAELATRLAVFKDYIDSGASDGEAAMRSREYSTDFNKYGNQRWMNSAWMFSGSVIGGAVRQTASLVQGKSGKQLMLGLFAYGVLEGMMEHFYNADDDEKGRKSGQPSGATMTEYNRANSLYFRMGDRFIRAPFHAGPFSVLKYAGNLAARAALGDISGADAAKHIAKEAFDNGMHFTGTGDFNSDTVWQSLAPTLFVPFLQLSANEDYAGRPIQRRMYSETKPYSENGRKQTGDVWKSMARGMNELTGGNERRRGWFDFSPEKYKFVVDSALKNLGRDITTVSDFVTDLREGKDVDRSHVLFGRDYVRSVPDNTQNFYEAESRYKADSADGTIRQGSRRDEAVKKLLKEIDTLRHWEDGEEKVGRRWVKKRNPPEATKEKHKKLRLRYQQRVIDLMKRD